MVLVSVVVVTHQSRSQLSECLASATREADVPTELIVVDNASTDGGPDLVLAQFPDARLMINEENLGFAAAVNQGLGVAQGEFLLALNPDVVLLSGALRRLVEFLEGHPESACAAPRQWVDEDRTWQWGTIPWPPHWATIVASLPGLWRVGMKPGLLVRRWHLNRETWRTETPKGVPFLSGACMLLRTSSLRMVGGLDQGYFLFFEDVDLCVRLRQAGWGLYLVPQGGVLHAARGSVRTVPGQVVERHLLESGRRYLRRHGDPLTRLLWSLVQGRRAYRRGASCKIQRQDGIGEEVSEITLRWPALPWASSYWVEVARDPTFLYGAGAWSEKPKCRLPEGLSRMGHGGRLFWRVAGVDPRGRLGPFVTRVFPGPRSHARGKEALI